MMLLLLLGCEEQAVETTCDTLCAHLVTECSFDAYPSMDSCVQGCAWQAEQGGDVEGEWACIEKAGCDAFGVLECEHKFGGIE